MKILYDISVLGMGHYHPRARTGIFRVVENLANGLVDSPEIDLNFCSSLSLKSVNESRDYLLANSKFSNMSFIAPSWQNDIYIEISKLISNIGQQKKIGIASKVKRRLLYSIMNTIEQNTKTINNKQIPEIELFHSPFYPIPEYLQSHKRIKKILTIYDLIPILYPQFFEFQEDHLIKKALHGLKPDNWVTCISHATKNDLCNYLPTIDPDQVIVTPLAASELFYPCHNHQEIESIKKKYQIPNGVNYILSLSTLEPRKNIDHTIRCFAKLVEQENIKDLYLVLVGTKGWDYEKIFNELSNLSTLKARVIVTGYVADEDLAALYSGAMAFVYPSFYEGFGLPPLEAMQCGVPVITSNTSSLPEVVSDAGIMVSPTDTDALCQSMLDIYTQSSLRETMALQSIKQAKKFSWQKCTQETINAYKAALNT
jgi:glycosyltransferase involved in cell wall biosynthesis